MATTSRPSLRQSSDGCAPPAVQNKIVLSIQQKLEIIDSLLQKGPPYSTIAEKHGIGRSTIADIKKNEGKLRSTKQRMAETGVKNVKVNAMKLGAHEKLDEGLYIWFR